MGAELASENPDNTATLSARHRAHRWMVAGLFLYLWLMVGFASGTLTLLGPTRWLKAALGIWGFSAYEDQAMWGVMLLLVAGSFLLARLLYAAVLKSHRRLIQGGIPLTATALAGIAFAAWSDPASLAGLAGATEQKLELESGAEFVFGPYPKGTKLAELKQAGFTAVISLQHPAVVPLEPQRIAAERVAAAEIGIEFIHAPMLPWVSDNEKSLALIRELAETGKGKYYVHCGLGRDRANVVKAMVERLGTVRVTAAPELKQARSFGDRVAEGRFLMERGNFQVLEPELWLVPWPNPYEAFGKLFSGQVEHITLIMDPTHPEQAAWLDEAAKLFAAHGIPHRIEHFADGADLTAQARAVRTGPRPAVVIVPRTEPCPDAPIADAFLAAWERTGGPTGGQIVPGAGDPGAEGRPLPCEQG